MNIKSIIGSFEAEILLAHVLGVNRAYLHAYPERELSPEEEKQFLACLESRKQGVPIAYITQKREFWSLDLKVTADTLIPRPETELLVELILNKFKSHKSYYFLELATGSGAVSIALAKTCPHVDITASDISEKALTIARENQHCYQLNNIKFIQSDWFSAIPKQQKYHAVISNPPYIAENDPHLLQGDLRFEPAIALCAGKTGLEAIAHIIAHAPDYLLPSGWLWLEHGYDQAEAVTALFLAHGYEKVETKKDINSLPRVTYGQVSDIQLRV